MQVNEQIFRDYDIRGIVDTDLSNEFAECIGKAFGTYLLRKGTHDVLLGYDARKSSPDYYEHCVKGLLATGIHVIRIGLTTTPMMYWARKFYKIDGGLAVTASHNPPQYNGFKPASGNGALFGQAIQDIMHLMQAEDFVSGQGSVEDREIYQDYYNDIVSKVHLKRPLSVIVDCGNSTAGPFAPVLLEKLGVKVERLFCDIDPAFPHHPPDPEDPKAYPIIQEKIRQGGYDMGILFDGDADRVGLVDAQGDIVRGDLITALCARRILEDKPGEKILFEVQCSKSATDDVLEHGGQVKLIRVGHSYIEEALLNENAALAGETSGHVFFTDRWYGFDDAIYAACRLLEYVSETDESLKDLVESMPHYVSVPKTRIFAPDDRKFIIVDELKTLFKSQGLDVITIDGVRLEWPDGWMVVRASNTQPQLTLRAEAKTPDRLEEIKAIMDKAIAQYKKDGVDLVWGAVQ